MVTGQVGAKTQQAGKMIVQGMARPTGLFILALLIMLVSALFGLMNIDNMAGFGMFIAFGILATVPLVFPQVPPNMPTRKAWWFLVMIIIGAVMGVLLYFDILL